MRDYIAAKLEHEEGCPGGNPNRIPFKPDGSLGDVGPCNCIVADILKAWDAREEITELVRRALEGE